MVWGWWGWVGEVVFSVEVDVFVDGRREMCEVVPGDLGSCFGEVLGSGFGVDGVPGGDGVGEEGYVFALEGLGLRCVGVAAPPG